MAGEVLLAVMKEVAQNALPKESTTDLMYGKVTSKSPLKINIENRFEIDDSMLVISPLCCEKSIEIELPSLAHTSTAGGLKIEGHKHKLKDDETETELSDDMEIKPSITILDHPEKKMKVTIWDGLQMGDDVAILRVSQGQRYIVMFKVGGAS